MIENFLPWIEEPVASHRALYWGPLGVLFRDIFILLITCIVLVTVKIDFVLFLSARRISVDVLTLHTIYVVESKEHTLQINPAQSMAFIFCSDSVKQTMSNKVILQKIQLSFKDVCKDLRLDYRLRSTVQLPVLMLMLLLNFTFAEWHYILGVKI